MRRATATVAATLACGGVTGFGCGAAVFAAAGGINGAIDHCGSGNSVTACATGILGNAGSRAALEIAGYATAKLAGAALRAALIRIAATKPASALASKLASRLTQRGRAGAIQIQYTKGFCTTPRGADDLVDLASPGRRTHILDGECDRRRPPLARRVAGQDLLPEELER